MFYLEVSISNMKMAVFLGAAKHVVGLLWHSSIWNFLMKNKEKNQAHEELGSQRQKYIESNSLQWESKPCDVTWIYSTDLWHIENL